MIKDKCKDNLKICSWIIHVCNEDNNRKIVHENCGIIRPERTS